LINEFLIHSTLVANMSSPSEVITPPKASVFLCFEAASNRENNDETPIISTIGVCQSLDEAVGLILRFRLVSEEDMINSDIREVNAMAVYCHIIQEAEIGTGKILQKWILTRYRDLNRACLNPNKVEIWTDECMANCSLQGGVCPFEPNCYQEDQRLRTLYVEEFEQLIDYEHE
jgi:hypothetical protein